MPGRVAVPNLFGTRDWFHGSAYGVTGDGAQVSFSHLPAVDGEVEEETGGRTQTSFAGGPVPKRPQTGTGPQPGSWGP